MFVCVLTIFNEGPKLTHIYTETAVNSCLKENDFTTYIFR